MSKSEDARLKLRSELAQVIASTIHGRMYACELLPGPFYWDPEGDPEDVSKSFTSTMSAYDILDALDSRGYKIVKK